jgi:hypothetical protein
MRIHRAVLLASCAAAMGAAVSGPSSAQAPLPPCDAAHNGKLSNPQLADVEQRSGSKRLYATHLVRAKLFADARVDEPFGVQYDTDPGSERLAPGPGVVAPLGFLSNTPGPVQIPVIWTVTRAESFGDDPEPFCQGSESIAATLRKPARTSLVARESITDLSGAEPRVKIVIGGYPRDDLRPVTVRMRRGTHGRTRDLFTVQLANVTPRAGGFRFKKRAAGVTVRSSATQAFREGRGLVTVGVSMPRVRDGGRVSRNFTVELVREGRVLMRVHDAITCRGRIVGPPPAMQLCDSRGFRVTRPG